MSIYETANSFDDQDTSDLARRLRHEAEEAGNLSNTQRDLLLATARRLEVLDAFSPDEPETYDADMNREEARLFPDFYPQPTLTAAEVADVEGLTVHVYNALAADPDYLRVSEGGMSDPDYRDLLQEAQEIRNQR